MHTSTLLGYLGLIPFVICLYLSTAELSQYTVIVEPQQLGLKAQQAFIAYSAIILSFMAGTLWKKTILPNETRSQIISNIFSLIGFSALLVPSKIALIILVVTYLTLYFYEQSLTQPKAELRTDDYMNMRFRLTLMVVIIHISAFKFWFL